MNMRKITDKIEKEPGSTEKEAAWLCAIGIQAADGLRTSDYLWQISQKNINGKISIDEADEAIQGYYFERNAHDSGDPEREEADKVALNIVKILLKQQFDLSVAGLASLHRRIFNGVYEEAGLTRDTEVSKKEWVLGGDISTFLSPEALPGSLEECIAQERQYKYYNLTSDTIISHLSAFIAKLWHICPFEIGNTRFIAVLTILYLRHIGLSYEIDTFKNDSWYFHNALVRANYRNIDKNIDYEPIYLERFFRNLLLSEQWDLRNRYVHVRPAAEWSNQPKANNDTSTGQVQLKKDTRKVKEEGINTASGKEFIIKTKYPETDISVDFLPEIVEIGPAHDKSEGIQASSDDKILDNPNTLFLIVAIGEDFLSVRDIMARLHLKGRDNFLKLYLAPAVDGGLVSLLYPKSPRHPRQKYLLTQKGIDLLSGLGQEMRSRIERHLAHTGV